MRCLTVRQPYATAIMSGAKRVENRSHYTRLRGRIGVHAAKQLHERAVDADGRLPLGVILGTVQLVACHLAGSAECSQAGCNGDPFADFRRAGEIDPLFHWMLDEPREYVTPIRARGYLGFWEPEPAEAYLMEIAEVAK